MTKIIKTQNNECRGCYLHIISLEEKHFTYTYFKKMYVVIVFLLQPPELMYNMT